MQKALSEDGNEMCARSDLGILDFLPPAAEVTGRAKLGQDVTWGPSSDHGLVAGRSLG